MSSFHERQKSLFDHLKDAEDQCGFSTTNKASRDQDLNVIDRRTYRKLKHEMKPFRGRESIYKRGEATLKQCLRSRTIPDHIKNPNNWVYYSLADVTPDQMSDATNTATALALLQQMEEQREEIKMEPEFDDSGLFKKPTFKMSKTIKKEEPDFDTKPVFKSNKIIMPEYVVGVSKKKTTPVKRERGNSSDTGRTELKLNHLYDDDNEEDD